MKKIAIIIPTYKRPFALSRLLNSIENASYIGNADITLIISVEGQCDPKVIEIAEAFDWSSEKIIIRHNSRLGLRDHIIFCGDQVEKYDAVIVLEEDLMVSPYYYEYAIQVLNTYDSQEGQIASFSLYSFAINEYASLPFQSIDDGFDNYFIQTCSSWGQIWTRSQWRSFRKWYEHSKDFAVTKDDRLPEQVAGWPDTSWKKYFNKYMVENNLYSVIPRISLTTNFGDMGEHHGGTNKYQVPILNSKKEWSFSKFNESQSVYDVFFEPILECLVSDINNISSKEISCDLYGLKHDAFGVKYIISSRICNDKTRVVATYGCKMQPEILNILYNIKGYEFSLIKIDNDQSIKMLKQQTGNKIARSVSFLTKRQIIHYVFWLVRKIFLKKTNI